MTTNRTPLQRLMDNVSPEPTSGCWLWTGAVRRESDGYGCMSIANVTTSAHRAAWLLLRGAIPPGLFVCHKCDNPACVNPDHLFLGTAADNQADKVAKRRSTAGVRNPNAKLTPDEVRVIRAMPDGVNYSALAREFGVSDSLIHRIRKNEVWR